MFKVFLFTVFTVRYALALSTLGGMVQDGSKNPIDHATLTLHNISVDQNFQAVSSNGRYWFPGLPEGTYLLEVAGQGFGLLCGAVRLTDSERHELDLVLTPGDLATVNANSPHRMLSSGFRSTPGSHPVVKPARLFHKVEPIYPEPDRMPVFPERFQSNWQFCRMERQPIWSCFRLRVQG